MKLQHMLIRKAPQIFTVTQEDLFDVSDTYNLEDENFMMAIGVEHWVDGPKMDSRYLMFTAAVIKQSLSGYVEELYPMYPCTEEQFAKFYPPES